MRRFVVSCVLAVGVAALLTAGQRARAAGGDFKLDFVASAPFTYNHSTGGGAFDDRTVGKNFDIVESLEGGDFACGDIVTYLTQIVVNAGAFAGAQTIDLPYRFTADTTGQSGVALIDITGVQINYGSVSGGDGPGGTDSGISDDGGSTATLQSKTMVGVPFTKGAELRGTVRVNDLEPGEEVVVRIDVLLGCNGQSPSGNMQGRLAGAVVVAPQSEVGAIGAGAQTVPFKQVGDIKKP
jgi:hypothetical protein